MTKADLRRKWVNLRNLKVMLSPFLSVSEIDKLAKSEKPPFTSKTFRATYYDAEEVQRYIDKKLKVQNESPKEHEKS